jgi:N-acetyl-anhydromuramyl-L-alanine amidase AmpD
VTPWLSYPRIQAANCGPQRTRSPADLIVLHTMESPEKPGTARGVANWFAGRLGAAPKASAHFCVGPEETIQCVALDVVGWHAPGANARAVGIEQTGRAGQTAAQWDDSASRAMLTRSARLCAELVRALDIPPKRIDAAAVRAGEPGICGHHDVTVAFPERGSGHYDPGKAFPWDRYMAAVADELAKRKTDPAIAPPLDPQSLPVLKVGSTGEHVRLLQERLRYHLRPVKVDGVFGMGTHAALYDFQSNRGLSPDGIAGAITWTELLKQ